MSWRGRGPATRSAAAAISSPPTASAARAFLMKYSSLFTTILCNVNASGDANAPCAKCNVYLRRRRQRWPENYNRRRYTSRRADTPTSYIISCISINLLGYLKARTNRSTAELDGTPKHNSSFEIVQ